MFSDHSPHLHRQTKRAIWLLNSLLLSLAMVISLVILISRQTASAESQPSTFLKSIDTKPRQPSAGEDSEQEVDILITLEASVDLDNLNLPIDKLERRYAVVNALQSVAQRSQIDLIDLLKSLQDTDLVSSYNPLWIVNAIQVRGHSSIIPELSSLPGVKDVIVDEPIRMIQQGNVLLEQSPSDAPWGLEKIRARHVWDGLGIDGSSVTVALVDTGVDWQHPALLDNYRGFTGGAEADHASNWFDALDGTMEPFDPNGHGTHVAGTAVGTGGIGVAPGARWIAVRILDANGFGTIGNIHAGFQWLLAPNGEPSLGPDIASNSWGTMANLTDFLPDVLALKSAGIIPVFAAGNDGPAGGTIHTPAGYPDTFSVGASDDVDGVVWFSSRGPSDHTAEIKPALVAPGAYVLSAQSGGGFAYRDGTSMATPHVAGVFALILSANPALNEAEISAIMTSTAMVIDSPTPSYNSGWGRVDAYSAVSMEVSGGLLAGKVVRGGVTLPGVTVRITTTTGSRLNYTTNELGRYSAYLKPGLYGLAVDVFGQEHFTADQIAVTGGQTTIFDIHLLEEPKGIIAGRVIQAESGIPLQATVYANDTPVATITDETGGYTISLPEGTYELVASSEGHRLGKAMVAVSSGLTLLHDFVLREGPESLLVDSGQWYYRSQIGFFETALTENNYRHDLISIRDPLQDVPSAETLSEYDAVVWSSPTDSPAQIGAGDVISSYLAQGGKLFISGQNVGTFEELLLGSHSWWSEQLDAIHQGEMEPPFSIAGLEGSIFSTMAITLNGASSAGNQEATNHVGIRSGSFTEAALEYDDGSLAGLQAGVCEPFNIVYLGFGLEGVSGAENRSEMISRAFDYFALPDRDIGIGFRPELLNDIAVPGYRLTKTIDVINLSELVTDTVHLEVSGNNWPVSIITNTLTLGSCQAGRTTFIVDVPSGASRDTVEEFSIVATSEYSPEYSETFPVHLKTPGAILLVDDDRWYDQELTFRSALDAGGFDYDFWEIGSSPIVRGSPPSQTLNAYDIVIWYTGYDWFAPITDDEQESLASFLDHGGRLFLTSQDYLDMHPEDPFSSHYLGVRSYQESVTPTLVFAGVSPTFLDILTRPIVLDFNPYQNFADGLVAMDGNDVSLWHDGGMAAGVSSKGDDWRTVFWAFPFETLPEDVHSLAINQIIGWLSDLGDSTFDIDSQSTPTAGEAGSLRSFTVTLRSVNGAPSSGVIITNTLPDVLELDPGSITGGAQYDPARHRLIWQGQISANDTHIISYRAEVDPSVQEGTLVKNKFRIFYDNHKLSFERIIPLWVGTADLSSSELLSAPQDSNMSSNFIYHMEISNSLSVAGVATATIYFPGKLTLNLHSITSTSGALSATGHLIEWHGSIEGHQTITLAFAVTATRSTRTLLLPIVAVISDGRANLVVLDAFVEVTPYRSFVPLALRYS